MATPARIGLILTPFQMFRIIATLTDDQIIEIYRAIDDAEDEEEWLIRASAWLRAHEARRNRG